MEIRKAIKKVVALSAGVTMLGATMMGAVAQDLSEYPSPFVKDGQADAVVVVGEQAATSDVVGAIDIAASLQAASVSEVAVTVSGSGVDVVGGEDVDVVLGGNAAKSGLKDNDLPALLDTTIDFNEEDIDVHEEIVAENTLVVDYSLNAGADDELEDEPYLTTQAIETLKYQYIFEELVNVTDIGEGTDEDVLEITMLGKNLEITAAADSGDADEITVKASQEYFAAVGDVINTDGHSVTLINVGQDAAVVKVDGQTKTINDGDTVTFDEAGDYKVEVSDIFYVDEKEDRSVTLALGDDITDTVKTGDSMELFGYDEDEDEADWLWDISIDTDGTLNYIGATHNFIMKDAVATDDDERPAVPVGEKIMFPNDYAYVEAASMETDTYETLTVQPTSESLSGTSYDVVEFTHSGDDELFTVAGVDTDTVWAVRNDSMAGNVSYWYDDDGDDVQTAATWFKFTIDGESINVTFDAVDQFIFEVSNPIVETWNLTVGAADTDAFNDYFGAKTGEAEADELVYEGSSIGTTDTLVLSKYGIKSKDDPESMMDDDKLELVVPDEQQKVKVVFGTSGTSVSGTSGEATSDKVNAIGVGLGVLDKDVTVGSQNMIVVGGPCVNTIAAELMGNPANCAEGFEMGKAMVKLYENNGKSAMLVAGYSALDTQGATRVVSQYDKYDLSGTEASVTVTSLNSISVE